MTDIEKTIKEYETIECKCHKSLTDFLKRYAGLFADNKTFKDYLKDDCPTFFEIIRRQKPIEFTGKKSIDVERVTKEGIQTSQYFSEFIDMTTDELCIVARYVEKILKIKRINEMNREMDDEDIEDFLMER